MIKPYVVSFSATKAFVSAVKAAAGVVPKITSRHVLQSVRLSFSRFEVTVEATDLELWYRCTLPLKEVVTQPFTLLITKDAAKTIKAGMDLVFNETFYTIGSIKYEPVFDDSSFPKFPVLDSPKRLTVDSNYFDDLAACAVSAADSEVRPILTIVCHREDILVATDGLRALYASQPMTLWTEDVNVPAWSTSLLKKTFGKTGADMRYDGHYVSYRAYGCEITLKQFKDGTYPDVSRILPKSSKIKGLIDDVKPWVDACDSVLTAHKQAEKGHRDGNKTLTITLENNTASISCRVPGGPSFNTEIPFSFSGDDILVISLNAEYLKDALLQTGADTQMRFNGPKDPVLLIGSSNTVSRRKALVSPLFQR